MTWTDQKPTETGWYWYRDAKTPEQTVMLYDDADGNLFAELWCGKICHVDTLHGQWAGPIPMPEEP